VSVSVSTFNV